MSRNDGPPRADDLPLSGEIHDESEEIEDEQEDRLESRERAHGRALLRTALWMIEWQERADPWPILKRSLSDGELACLVNADGRTVLLDPAWLEFVASFVDGSEYRLGGGGEFVLDQALALKRGLSVPAVVSTISFRYADLAQRWPDAVARLRPGWDRRPTRNPTVEFYDSVVRPATALDGCLLLRTAVAVVGEWERADKAEAWQIIKRGIQVGNLQVWARAERQAVKIEPAWIDFLRMFPDGNEYQADGSGEIVFDDAKAASYGLAVPARVVAIKIKLDELQRIWPGCVTRAARTPPIVLLSQAKPMIEGHKTEPLAPQVPKEGSSIGSNPEHPTATQARRQSGSDNERLSVKEQVFKALDHLKPPASSSIKVVANMVLHHCEKNGFPKWSDRNVRRHVTEWRETKQTS